MAMKDFQHHYFNFDLIHLSSIGATFTLSNGRKFTILKAFKVNIHPSKSPIIEEVVRHPAIDHWIE
ncbi:hypothetical protein MTR_2g436330 [Medicago truncatula]|uniref:Uncharacterized protein n=1 Tax=Medicago truncatula TaxID=3880 RepID=A0A072V6H6_MEDTR|nr:hypothetical protein MTR_2g436330 [Medicago truncatula]